VDCGGGVSVSAAEVGVGGGNPGVSVAGKTGGGVSVMIRGAQAVINRASVKRTILFIILSPFNGSISLVYNTFHCLIDVLQTSRNISWARCGVR
jgi:hypothetical protein